MSASCGEVRGRFAAYAGEHLPASERGEIREHLARCRPCAFEAAAFDPAFLFAAVPSEEVSPDEAARILSAVRTGIALQKAERLLKRAPRGRRAGAAAAAAAAVVFTLLLPGASRRNGERAGNAATNNQPQMAGARGGEGSGGREVSGPASSPAALPSETGTFPAKATIYDWSPGAGHDGPRVVWIVDRSLDI